MRVLVCGGRNFADTRRLVNVLLLIHEVTPIETIIEGGASGADTIARSFGNFLGIPVDTYFAEWKKYGKRAGPLRNKRMIEDGKPDLVVAFPGGAGTADMIKQATIAKIKTMEIGD